MAAASMHYKLSDGMVLHDTEELFCKLSEIVGVPLGLLQHALEHVIRQEIDALREHAEDKTIDEMRRRMASGLAHFPVQGLSGPPVKTGRCRRYWKKLVRKA